jgi:hypothetical protein
LALEPVAVGCHLSVIRHRRGEVGRHILSVRDQIAGPGFACGRRQAQRFIKPIMSGCKVRSTLNFSSNVPDACLRREKSRRFGKSIDATHVEKIDEQPDRAIFDRLRNRGSAGHDLKAFGTYRFEKGPRPDEWIGEVNVHRTDSTLASPTTITI